jgi:hypothetical protein
MTQRFDPVGARRGAEFELEYRSQLDDEKGRSSTIGQVALSRMGSVVAAWLVGLEPEYRSYLQQLRAWFEESSTKDEKFGEVPHFWAAARNDAYGLCCWMLDGKQNPAPYSLAVKSWNAHFLTEGKKEKRGGPKFDYAAQRYEDPFIRGIPFEPKDILHGSLADYLSSCLQSDQFSLGAGLYERVGGRTNLTDTRIQTDVHLGYWLCKQAESGGVPPNACQTIGKRVLRSNLQGVWLSHGQYLRAATWLKVVASYSNWQLSPLEVILQAYDLMPDVVRPSFV